jgi:hypothetical protein
MNLVTRAIACALIASTVAPATARAVPAKHLNSDGSVPSRWNLAKPAASAHDDTAPASASGTGDGSNAIVFSGFESGDMIVTGGSLTGHAGEWDGGYYRGSLYDACIWSANTTPVNGVQREAPRKYRAYDCAWGLWVPSLSATKRAAARSYCRIQLSEPYDISSSKSNQSAWYCSKLCWSSYRYTVSFDLDADGGYWVWPIDLVNDGQTAVFAYSD